MTLSAAFMAALGLVALFLPQEILRLDAEPAEPFTVILVQIIGALYLGFAMLNWSAKGTLLGGIYGRPVVLGNFWHFLIGAIAVAKFVAVGHRGATLLMLGVAYSVFAAWFAYVMFGPGPRKA